MSYIAELPQGRYLERLRRLENQREFRDCFELCPACHDGEPSHTNGHASECALCLDTGLVSKGGSMQWKENR